VNLSAAAWNGHLDVIKYLVDKGANVNTAISAAASKGNMELIDELMKLKGADASKVNLSGAAQNGHLDVIKYLVDKGADVNLPNQFGTAPLLLAAACGHEDIVKFLLSRGGKLDESHTRRSVAAFREQKSEDKLKTALAVLEKVGAKDALSLLKSCMDEPRAVMKGDGAIDSGSIENSNN
jgi:ankyrin repeat protein